MPQRWGIWLSVEGDLRFLSHRDMMRAMDRATVRAALPLRYTRGFNPHPQISLPCPKPVGVTGMDEMLVIRLEETQDSPDEGDLLRRLNENAPCGMHFLRAQRLAGKQSPQPRRIACELPLSANRAERVRSRIADLNRRENWTVERATTSKRRNAPKKHRTIDVKVLIEGLTVSSDVLRWDAVGCDDLWARPGEVLNLLGLDDRRDLAAVTRTRVDYDL